MLGIIPSSDLPLVTVADNSLTTHPRPHHTCQPTVSTIQGQHQPSNHKMGKARHCIIWGMRKL